MLTILKHCRLQVEIMEHIIVVVKNWPNDPCANCKPNSNFKQYLNKKESLAKENYNSIEEHNFFEELKVDVD